MDVAAVEVAVVEVFQVDQPAAERVQGPPPATLWRLCAWHDDRTPPAGVEVTHVMCQLCYDLLEEK